MRIILFCNKIVKTYRERTLIAKEIAQTEEQYAKEMRLLETVCGKTNNIYFQKIQINE